jgi:uncharacterized protein
MDSSIKLKLAEIEHEYDIRILYACESGSRAWGFASPDSDYDVRFVYVHPAEYYLSIDDKTDVIELDINDLLDINGWDLRKALRLFRGSNAALYEWLQSPIVYQKDENFYDNIMAQVPRYFSIRAGMHHYLSMTRSCFEKELQGDTVRLKKYFYALRPILAALWIAEKKEMPPMDFESLRAFLPVELDKTVDKLLNIKAEADEKYRIEKVQSLNDFIYQSMLKCEEVTRDFHVFKGETMALDALFRQAVFQEV